MARGIIAVSLDEGDELISAKITNGRNFVFLGSHQGQAIRFKEAEVRAMGRQARGVRGMDLARGDYLIGMEVVEEEGLILSIAENGFGKRTKLDQLPPHRARRQGRDQHEDHRQDRAGGGNPFGEGRFRPDDRQPERQDHPHRSPPPSARPAAPPRA